MAAVDVVFKGELIGIGALGTFFSFVIAIPTGKGVGACENKRSPAVKDLQRIIAGCHDKWTERVVEAITIRRKNIRDPETMLGQYPYYIAHTVCASEIINNALRDLVFTFSVERMFSAHKICSRSVTKDVQVIHRF